MSKLPRLNFPQFEFKITTVNDALCVWDSVRRGWYVLTPEEWIRQHVMRYFVESQFVPATLIVAEHPVSVQGMAQRADIVVFGTDSRPIVLVECKAHTVSIDNVVFAQAVRYNAVVGAQYIMLTNGLRHYCYTKNEIGEYAALDIFPDFSKYFR